MASYLTVTSTSKVSRGSASSKGLSYSATSSTVPGRSRQTLSSRAMEARALLIEAARKPEVRRTLHDSMIRGTSDEKIYLAQVMAASGDNEQLPLLEQLSRDPDVKVAQEGLRALRTLKARVQ